MTTSWPWKSVQQAKREEKELDQFGRNLYPERTAQINDLLKHSEKALASFKKDNPIYFEALLRLNIWLVNNKQTPFYVYQRPLFAKLLSKDKEPNHPYFFDVAPDSIRLINDYYKETRTALIIVSEGDEVKCYCQFSEGLDQITDAPVGATLSKVNINGVLSLSIGFKRTDLESKTGGKVNKGYTRTDKVYVGKDGIKRTIYVHANRQYVKRKSKSTGKFVYRIIR